MPFRQPSFGVWLGTRVDCIEALRVANLGLGALLGNEDLGTANLLLHVAARLLLVLFVLFGHGNLNQLLQAVLFIESLLLDHL